VFFNLAGANKYHYSNNIFFPENDVYKVMYQSPQGHGFIIWPRHRDGAFDCKKDKFSA